MSDNSAPNTITYALKIHCKSEWEKPNCCCTAGSATPMIDVSIMTKNCASESTTSASSDGDLVLLLNLAYCYHIFLVVSSSSSLSWLVVRSMVI
jgi:hypothetical protein